MKNALSIKELPNDILVQILDLLDHPSQLQMCLTSKAISRSCIKVMWRIPRCTKATTFKALMSTVDNSNSNYYPYSIYMIGLSISFSSVQTLHYDSPISPIPLKLIRLENVLELSIALVDKILCNNLQQIHLSKCAFNSVNTFLDAFMHHGPYDKLEKITIDDSHMSDQLICQMITMAPDLRHLNYSQSGFISDKTVDIIVQHCPLLETFVATLPRPIIQANTVTFTSLEKLAQLKHLKIFVCKGQVRISKIEYKNWLYKHCPSLKCCNL